MLCKSKDCTLLAAKDLPHSHLLKAEDNLVNCAAVRSQFFNYPGVGDSSKVLDGLVLEGLGFEKEPPHRLRVCRVCLRDLSRKTMPEAALANGLWLGNFQEHLQSASFVEMIAASSVRVSSFVLALDELKHGNIAGSAKSLMRGTFTFYMQDAYGVQLRLPACDTDIAGSFTIALVGARPTMAQLTRLFGARRQMVQDLLDYQLDKDNLLVGEHKLVRQANLASYNEDGSVPQAILGAIIAVKDPTRSYANARSTHAHGDRETETPVNSDTAGAVQMDDTIPSAPFIIETNAVMDTGEDRSVSDASKPSRLRNLGASMATGTASLQQQAAAEAAVRAGWPSPLGTDKAMVLTHSGKFVSDFYDGGLFIGAFYDLFPHGVGGFLDSRPRRISFKTWAQTLLKRRDPRFRKHRTFAYCVCALIFRREAISNARFKLNGRVSTRVARLLATVKPTDLCTAASEMEGKSGLSTMRSRPGVQSLIRMMESVHSGSSWTIYNKKSTRMITFSYIMQKGQPLIWLTLNPADHNSPIVMKLAGVEIDVTSNLKSGFPDYVDKLRLVATDPVASAEFFHNTIDAVLTCLLRFGASDEDGGVFGRIRAYVGVTEEQKRLMLHFHLLV